MPLRPRMIVIAGPPGSGKSTAYPVYRFGVDSFNADDRAAVLNGGSYQNIPPVVRAQVNREFEQFVLNHIATRSNMAFETTLRTDITIRQARQAQQAGFFVDMRYLGTADVQQNIERVQARADRGGHAAPASQVESTYALSMTNMVQALRDLDRVRVYDNSRFGEPPVLLLEVRNGSLRYVAENSPAWLKQALRDTEYVLQE